MRAGAADAPDLGAEALALLETDGPGVHTGVRMIGANNADDSTAPVETYRGEDGTLEDLLAGNFIDLNALVVRRDVAAAVGPFDETLRRWIEEPVFRSVVLRARRESYGQAIGLTQRYAPVAGATLVKVMNDPSAAASAKVTAAAVLLKLGREGVEIDDLIERVEQLEEAARPAKAVASRTVEATVDADDEEEP